jgi:hypothetical protein
VARGAVGTAFATVIVEEPLAETTRISTRSLDLLLVKEVLLVLAFSTTFVEELLAETTSVLTRNLDLLVKANNKNARNLLQSGLLRVRVRVTQNQQAVTAQSSGVISN